MLRLISFDFKQKYSNEIILKRHSLKEIEKYLIDDPELSNHERYELYCDERDRMVAEKEASEAQSLDELLNDIGIEPYEPKKGRKK